ncbi:MAG: outer membrane beta-barrel protein [Rhodobacteraceae bacterium]|nr:outer membrane beta-barrel protein [Paracoccaceae bacterium]
MKKSIVVSSAATSTLALLAASGSAHAQDWSGFYGGVSLNYNSGDIVSGLSGSSDYGIGGHNGSVFVGHNWNVGNGNTVAGVELALSLGDVDMSYSGPGSDYLTISNIFDVKGRVGQSMGKTLVYGFAGLSFGTRSSVAGDYNISGTNVGIGVSHMINENFAVGAELMRLNMDGGYSAYGSAKMNSASLRLEMKF